MFVYITVAAFEQLPRQAYFHSCYLIKSQIYVPSPLPIASETTWFHIQETRGHEGYHFSEHTHMYRYNNPMRKAQDVDVTSNHMEASIMS